MSLHARNVAITAGASGQLIDMVVEQMVKEHKVRMDRAEELVEEFKRKEK
jgi:hydroxymethylglutaryl-CoA reductase